MHHLPKSTPARFIKHHWFGLCIVLILLLAIFFRFYNFENRWALAGDQARDVLIARESLHQQKLPVIGPFSSAGNFTTGPIWYWWVIASYMLFPFSLMTPWVVLAASFVLIVYLMILIGKELGGKPLAILLGLLATVSPAQIDQSRNLTNPSLVALFSTLALYCALKYVKNGKNLPLFLFSFFISQAIQTHFQSTNLLILIPLALILKKTNVKGFLSIIAGITLPLVPYFLYDIQNNFYNIRGIIDYILYGQYKIYVPNRWLTYIGTFWPHTWASVIGGIQISGYITLFLSGIIILLALIKKKLTKPHLLVFLSFLLMFIALRYYRGEKLGGYFIFLHPFILAITAWSALQLMKIQKIVGILFIVFLIIGSSYYNFKNIISATNYTAFQAENWSNLLINSYPEKKFMFYASRYTSDSAILPLLLYLDQKNKLDENGQKIGFGNAWDIEKLHHTKVPHNTYGFELWDLQGSSSAELKKVGWNPVSPASIAAWYLGKKHEEKKQK